MIRLIPGFVCLFLGAVLSAVPAMTRRGVLFAVPVPLNFRARPEGRRSLAHYYALMAAAALTVLSAIFLSPIEALGPVIAIGPVVIFAVSAAGFIRQRRKLAPFAVQPTQVREADLSSAPDKIPGFVWFGAGPLAMIGAAAWFLHVNWDRIPLRFPVHWGMNGQPNRWSERTGHGVYGPLVFGLEMCTFLLALALAGWFGARRSPVRRILLGTMVATNNAMALLFAAIAVNPVVLLPTWLIVFGPLLVMALIVAVATRRISKMGAPAEVTPNECWKGGVIYYNPDDPALFVEKRTGLGYTMNFGNGWSWGLMAGLLAMIGSIRLLLL